jgi:transposase-like protein
MKSVIKRLSFPLEVMLVCVRWYVAYPLSLRNLEEMMQERGDGQRDGRRKAVA